MTKSARAGSRTRIINYFCGEEFFCHSLPLDRSSMTRWRQRMSEDRLNALLQESLAVAVKVGAAKPVDFTRAVIDTTVAEKDVAFPTDAKLIHKARERLVKQAKRAGIDLRQSYTRVGKRTLIQHQRYAHAKQFKRPIVSSGSSKRSSVAPSATLGARSTAMRRWRPPSCARCGWASG